MDDSREDADAVREMHSPCGNFLWAPFCRYCRNRRGEHVPWPCSTIQALEAYRLDLLGDRPLDIRKTSAGTLERWEPVRWTLWGVPISEERAQAIINFEKSLTEGSSHG